MIRKMLALLLCCWLVACSTLTVIESNPPGAAVRLNGRPLGNTPVTIQLDDGIWNTHVVDISLPGYQVESRVLERQLNVGRLVVGVVLWWPELLWVLEHHPVYYFELQPAPSSSLTPEVPGYLAYKAADDAIGIRINGEDLPVDHVVALPQGEHEVLFTRDGAEIGRRSLQITSESLTQLYLDEPR